MKASSMRRAPWPCGMVAPIHPGLGSRKSRASGSDQVRQLLQKENNPMNATPEPLALSISLIVPDDMRQQLSAGEKALEAVKDYKIEDSDTAQAIAEEMNGYK